MKDHIRVKDTVIRGKWWLLPKPEKDVPRQFRAFYLNFIKSRDKTHDYRTSPVGDNTQRCQCQVSPHSFLPISTGCPPWRQLISKRLLAQRPQAPDMEPCCQFGRRFQFPLRIGVRRLMTKPPALYLEGDLPNRELWRCHC
jgi:hypothetical protein